MSSGSLGVQHLQTMRIFGSSAPSGNLSLSPGSHFVFIESDVLVE